MFQFTTWHPSFLDFFIKLRRKTGIGNQFLISNDRNSVRRVVLGLIQVRVCTDLAENLSENIKGRPIECCHFQGCNVSPSLTDVSPTENSWMLHPLDKVSLGYFPPDRIIPSPKFLFFNSFLNIILCGLYGCD
jgi:hypothetical protein